MFDEKLALVDISQSGRVFCDFSGKFELGSKSVWRQVSVPTAKKAKHRPSRKRPSITLPPLAHRHQVLHSCTSAFRPLYLEKHVLACGYDALTDLDALDAFLSSGDAPEHCMQLSALDGFLTGIICSPKLTLLNEWLPVAFGSQDISDIPEVFIKLVIKRYNDISAALNSEPPFLEPVFWQEKEGRLIAMDWCDGFMDAFALYRDGWDELMRTELGREWMFPILAHLFDEDGKSLVGATEEQLDKLLASAAEEILETVPRIFTFRQMKRTPVRLN